jgi:hypothetical protein
VHEHLVLCYCLHLDLTNSLHLWFQTKIMWNFQASLRLLYSYNLVIGFNHPENIGWKVQTVTSHYIIFSILVLFNFCLIQTFPQHFVLSTAFPHNVKESRILKFPIFLSHPPRLSWFKAATTWSQAFFVTTLILCLCSIHMFTLHSVGNGPMFNKF